MVKQTSDSSKISHWSRLHSSTKVLKLDPTPMVLVTTSTCRSTTRMKLGSRDLDIDLSEIQQLRYTAWRRPGQTQIRIAVSKGQLVPNTGLLERRIIEISFTISLKARLRLPPS